MEHDEIVQQRLALYEAATSRSARDAAFRARLIAQPRQTLDALAAELGLEARAPEVEIVVHDWSPDRLHVLLPPPAEPPLADSELERIVGGTGMMGAAALGADSHGCPSCPHIGAHGGALGGPVSRRGGAALDDGG
jgi:hypothetical protein